MKLLFVCNTVYQVLVASNIAYSNGDKMKSDIIISDHSNDTKKLCDKINKNKFIFENAYYFETKHMQNATTRNEKLKNRKKIKKKIDKTLKIEDYSSLYCANDEPFTRLMFDILYKYNKSTRIRWFEDGIGTYSTDKLVFRKTVKRNNIKRWLKRVLFNINEFNENISEINLFNPDKVSFSTDLTLNKISVETYKNPKVLNWLNDVFDYVEMKDNYNRKIIFFEDGYKPFDDLIDLSVLNIIAKYYTKEDIIVKVHPRNKNNKFANYITNKNLNIPWELIVLNNNFEDTILITFYSSCVVTPLIIANQKINSFVLADIYSKSENELFAYLNEYYLKDNENFCVPKTLEEFEIKFIERRKK